MRTQNMTGGGHLTRCAFGSEVRLQLDVDLRSCIRSVDMSTDFDNVFCGLNPAPGKLRLAAGGIGWKQNEGGDKPVTVPANEMRHGEWIRSDSFSNRKL